MYSSDLAHIHDSGFGDFAARVAPHVKKLLERHRITGGTIVEIGCGSGILARHLCDAGYDVYGVDISPAMIRLARTRAPRATFHVASLADLAIPPCDAVLCLGEVVTYVVERDYAARTTGGGLPKSVHGLFARAHRALAAGGLLLFDFMHSASGRTYRAKTIEGDGWTLEVRADYNARARILTRRMNMKRRVGHRLRRAREVHRVRIYDPGDVVAALEDVGFDVEIRRSIGRYRLMTGDVAVIASKSTLG